MQPHTQSSYRHQDVRMTSFYDIHGNEVGEYGSFSGDKHDSDNYTENSEAHTEHLDLEDCNLEDITQVKRRTYDASI